MELKLSVLPGRLGVCRLAPGDPVPPWVGDDGFVSVTRTSRELSIVCDQRSIPPDVRCERDWRGLEVQGPLPFDAIGVMSAIAVPLADARISILAIATFDTDYALVQASNLERAVEALEAAGHRVEGAT
jgi:hypothetical protein